MAEPIPPATRRPSAAFVVLGLVVVSSIVVRSVVAWRHSVPRLFPDEYIYAALGRSVGHGHLQIRGATVHFPGVLEPISAAPIWRSFSVITAYHLVQTENAIAVSVAAIPAFYLARALKLTTWYSVAVAAYCLLIPELVLIAFTSSDAIAYPLALGAIALAVSTIDTPTGRYQIGFLVLASLATLARVEYFVLVPAYFAAAAVVERGNIWRRHRVGLMAVAPVAALFLVALFGYYARERQTPLDGTYIKWFFLQGFLLTVVTGVVMVPGAVAALTQPRTRRELAFAVFAGTLAVLLLAESTAHAADSSQFKERYLFVISALIPVGFGLYVRNGAPRRALVIILSLVIVIAAARLPLSEYATATFKMDSQSLFAVSYLQTRFGTADTSLVIALLATLGAVGAAALAYRPSLIGPITTAAIVVLVWTVLATHFDLLATKQVRESLPGNLTWVNKAARGPVTAIETPIALKQDLLYQLYWNTSITRELLLGTAIATDAFNAPKLVIGKEGVLENVHGDFLFHRFGTTARFANATVVASAGDFQLWRPRGLPRASLIFEGRFYDGWLSRSGRLRVWSAGKGGLQAHFDLSLPPNWKKSATLRFAASRFVVHPGELISVSCSSSTNRLDIRFGASGTNILERDLRSVSARLGRLVVKRVPAPQRTREACAVTST